MTVDERILELLSRWEDLRERGQTPTPEELCRECPDLLPEVKRRVEHLQRLTPSLPSTAEHQAPDRLLHGQQTDSGPEVPELSGDGPKGMRYHPLRFHARGCLGEVFVS